ncbi:MAG TPA: hypothetical protein DCF63_00545 [Planctomycetaceae bacterium]|nr:hypothetical protein [Planctomycetaceae bacterium]
MQLPIKAHYASLAMLALARQHQSGQLLTARTIAQEHEIPIQFLGQILQQLRTAGLIVSSRGSSGGFRLGRNPDSITMASVVEAVCSGSCNDYASSGETNDPDHNIVSDVWRELSELQSQFLEKLTLGELLRRAMPVTSGMFYI